MLFAFVMVFAIILSRQVVEGRSDGKHGEHHRDDIRLQLPVPPVLAADNSERERIRRAFGRHAESPIECEP